jgi:hypothetical protein
MKIDKIGDLREYALDDFPCRHPPAITQCGNH